MRTEYQKQGVFFQDGATNFRNEDQSDKTLTLTIKNDSADTDRYVALCDCGGLTAAQLSALTGKTVDGVIVDGEIISTENQVLSSSISKGKIFAWLNSINHNPRRISMLKMKVSDVDQFDSPIEVYEFDPFVGQANLLTDIIASDLIDPDQSNDKLVNIPINHLQFDNTKIVLYKVIAGAKATLTMSPGAFHSTSKALEAAALDEFGEYGLKRQVNGK